MWERKPVLLIVLATIAILVGTIITMVLPFAWVNTEADRIEGVTPYTALQQEGRDIYIRDGCNNCHTQTVRPLVPEVLRYGDYSKSGEFVYDRPFLWGIETYRPGPGPPRRQVSRCLALQAYGIAAIDGAENQYARLRLAVR